MLGSVGAKHRSTFTSDPPPRHAVADKNPAVGRGAGSVAFHQLADQPRLQRARHRERAPLQQHHVLAAPSQFMTTSAEPTDSWSPRYARTTKEVRGGSSVTPSACFLGACEIA